MEKQFYVWDEVSNKYIGNYFSNEKTLDNSTEIAPFNDFCEWNGTIWFDPRTEEEINSKPALFELYPELSDMNYKLIQLDNLELIEREAPLSNKGLKGEKKILL